MAWFDNIKTDYIITTGDNKQYKPNWLNAQKAVEYNISEFEFPNVSGTRVERGTPKGRKYNIEIYFQGENHLDTANSFETSANDSRAWTVQHPFYGSISVQPISLAFDNTLYNVSKITGTIIETISEENPQSNIDAKDKILEDKELVDASMAESFTSEVKPDAVDINTMSANNDTFYNTGVKKVKNNLDAENYFNLYNEANSAILNITEFPLNAINTLQAVINAPSLFADNVKNRISLLKSQFDKLVLSVKTIVKKFDKKLFENNAGVLISSMATATVTPQGSTDYQSKQDVLKIIEELTDIYNEYVENLDKLQSDNGGSEDSYIPDFTSQNKLNNLINFTVSNLFNIALGLQQERSIILEDDSNAILLTHRFYGLDEEDNNLDRFINTNNIGLNELLQIRKGRKIVYYI